MRRFLYLRPSSHLRMILPHKWCTISRGLGQEALDQEVKIGQVQSLQSSKLTKAASAEIKELKSNKVCNAFNAKGHKELTDDVTRLDGMKENGNTTDFHFGKLQATGKGKGAAALTEGKN
ncbi:hypothetical protein F511_28825 [Dorcoceras hygrometricum]|uniref:Uncharacterized protein n=1 Tax=Dorcoceras hygrometricum TaxID=472368 RepID=A0A2Z7ASB5_9LAMI|nr:hypothetical protein F511_28825 [Dorcoceras hygrometricum]